MIRVTIEAWERSDNPNLTYPIVTRFGIREMTKNQIECFIIGNPYYFKQQHEIRFSI